MEEIGEPCALGARVVDTREAARDVWGNEGVEATLARLSASTRATFAIDAVVPAWVPERTFMAWMTALWEGPCNQDQESFARWVRRLNDRGFGTARRLMLSLANPSLILRRADVLWHDEHTHGRMIVAPLDPQCARLTLRDHPFTETELSRAAISEALRHIISRCRVKCATETHSLAKDGSLHIVLSWG